MIRIRRSILIAAPPRAVFALVDDPARYPEFFHGITRWDSRSAKKKGVGARYRVLMKVGSIEAGGTVRVVRRDAPGVLSWEAEGGIRQEGGWELVERDDGTELGLEIAFHLSGGIVGALVERLAGRIVERNIWATLLAARRILEGATHPTS